MKLRVRSEVGRLRRALVHEPGPEIDRMVPAMMEQLLFDDILYGDRAREEFAQFRRVLQLLGVEVHDAADLLEQALERPEARELAVEILREELPPAVRLPLLDLGPAELAKLLVEGQRRDDTRAGGASQDPFVLPPLPNWCFQRDPQVVLGDGVVFCSMAAPARHREALLSRVVFRFHPRLRNTPVWVDPIRAEVDHPLFVGRDVPHLEGGDVLVLSPDVLAVGVSERTSRSGVRHLARALAPRSDRDTEQPTQRFMVVVELPARRAYMHLDTLITPVDRDACLVHAPVILPGGPESARVGLVDLHADDPTVEPAADLLQCLAACGVDLEPIPCGGDDPILQQREQWTDGANALAVAPGVITLYDRNAATAEVLSRRGFRVIEAEDLLLGREELSVGDGRRLCVLISSHEMSRARGGPHCLVHPLERDD